MVALWLLSEKIPKPSSVVMLELLVARRAALFVQELGFHESIFEGDSEICINALQSGMPLPTSYNHLIKDTLFYTCSLQSFSFSHIPMQDNALALFTIVLLMIFQLSN